MSIAVSKIRNDIRLRPGRTLLILLSVLVGTTAVTAGLIAVTVMGRAISESFSSSLPPDVVLATDDQTDGALDLISGLTGVIAVEPRRVLRGRIQTDDGFASLALTIVPNLNEQGVSRFENGQPDADGLLIERSSLDVWGQNVGSPAVLRLPGIGELILPTAGTAADAAVAPGVQDRIVYAYATPEMVGSLGRLRIPEHPAGHSDNIRPPKPGYPATLV